MIKIKLQKEIEIKVKNHDEIIEKREGRLKKLFAIILDSTLSFDRRKKVEEKIKEKVEKRINQELNRELKTNLEKELKKEGIKAKVKVKK